MKLIIDTFLKVLDKREGNYFKEFISVLPKDSSWYLISDYCIKDPTKHNDVITFSLLCNYDKHESIKDVIKSLAPKDLKKTKTINVDFLQYLNSPYLYHFSLIIPRNDKLLAKLFNEIPLDSMLNWMNDIYEKIKNASSSDVSFCNDAQVRLKLVQTEIKRQGYNQRLLREILLTSLFGATIMFLIQKYSSPTDIAWISDRDAIIDKFDGFVFDTMFFLYQHQLRYETFKKTNTKISFVEPEKVGLNYFDELIRIPDYIAGALASIDTENKESILELKEKYQLIFAGILADPINQATIKAECNEKQTLSVYNIKWMSNKKNT